jgi:RNA polymerase sigma-70 factor, ECF subfamily
MASEREHELLKLAANGVTDAFRSLFETHYTAMFRFAYRLTSAVDVAEDITQECFLRIIRSPGFDPKRGSLRQYLYGIVRNLVRQQRYANSREIHWDDEMEEDLQPALADRTDPMISMEIAEVVQAAISTLAPLQREAIVLFEFEELSLEEIAAIVGSDVGTIKSRLHRARERLRGTLSPYRSHNGLPPRKGATYESTE